MLESKAVQEIIKYLLKYAKEEGEKDYRVLRILKKVGITGLVKDDSRSVYAHALVRYGLEKQNPELMKLFALEDAQKAFEASIKEKSPPDPAKLQNELLYHLQRKKEFSRLKQEGIDLEREIREFTAEYDLMVECAMSPVQLNMFNQLQGLYEEKILSSPEYRAEKYLESLVEDFQADFPPNKDQYVDLVGEFRRPGEEMAREIHDPIDDFITSWLEDDSIKFLAVLGEYGTGKTTLCRYLAHRLALRREFGDAGPGVRDPRKRVPLIFPLRNVKTMSLEEFITSYMTNRMGVRLSYAEFLERHKRGDFVVFFDGFDEMAQKIDADQKKGNFFQIEELIRSGPGSKVLLTCREEYFRTAGERREALKEIEHERDYRVLHLPPFNDAQIQKYLETHSDRPKFFWNTINEVFDLHDLSKRPVLLDLIIRFLPRILQEGKPGEGIKASDLYSRCIKEELDRVFREKQRQFSTEKKLDLLKRLALWLFLNDSLSIHVGRLKEELKLAEFFNTTEEWKVEQHMNEFLTFTFLIKEADNLYRISHKSFRDYLTALALTDEINRGEIKHFGERETTLEINRFILEQGPDEKILLQWVETAKDLPSGRGRQGPNAAALLLAMDPGALKGKDLSGCCLAGMDFQNADLTGTVLRGADLADDRFANTVLRNSDLEKADLTDAIFNEMKAVRTIDVSANGKFLVSGGDDNNVKIWDVSDVKNVKELRTLRGHTARVASVNITRDMKYVVSGSEDKTLKLWDFEGNLIRTLKGHKDRVQSVCFSGNNRRVVSGSWDETIKLWGFKGNLIRTFEGHKEMINNVCFSRDSESILSGGNKDVLRLWDLEGNVLRTFNGHTNKIWSVQFSPDGGFILSGSEDKTLKLWDIEGDPVRTFEGHKYIVYSVCFSPDGKRIASGSFDKTFRLWDLEGKLIRTFKGHTNGEITVIFSPDGRRLFSSSNDATIRIWDADADSPSFGECLNVIEQKLDCGGMKIAGAKGLERGGFKVKKENAKNDWETRDGTLKEWLIERGAIIYSFECIEEYLNTDDYHNIDLEAFKYLRDANLKRFHEIIVKIIDSNKENKIRTNAFYVYKELL